MSTTVTPVALYDVANRAPVAAELQDAITEQQLADWEGEWLPELFRSVQRLKRAGVERAHWPQSRHWNWRQKTQAVHGFLGAPAFSLVCAGLTQGMMITDAVRHIGRLNTQLSKPLIYVDYLENAPWNRPELVTVPRYRGVGSIMIRAAIELSHEFDFGGRIGLHSLPQANSFYANTCGMTDLGPDDAYQRLRYFEMSTEQAEAFVQKGGRS